MANEAYIITKFGENGDGRGKAGTISAGSVIPTGTLLVLSADNTFAAHSAADQIPVGIAAFESTSTSTFTQMTALSDVEAEMTLSGSGTRGQFVKLSSSPNHVTVCSNADMTSSYATTFGVLTRSGTTGQRVSVRVNL